MRRKVLFIGSRVNVIDVIPTFGDLELSAVYVLEGSPLDHELPGRQIPAGATVRRFAVRDKAQVLAELAGADFDVLVSNGCPLILPVGRMRRPGQVFVNIHPTLLPDLKGKTPLNGVFLTHRQELGATMHFMDDGIDTGAVIAQARTPVTADLDQGLVYKISFALEAAAFSSGMRILADSGFTFEGVRQQAEGSYFNRTPQLQTIDLGSDDTDTVLDKVRSFGVRSQGSYLTLGDVVYRVFAAERIVNPYLLQTYAAAGTGEIVLHYDGKFIVRTRDGMVKVTDHEIAPKD